MFRILLLPLILLMSVAVFSQIPKTEPGVSRELARWRAANYSDIAYKLDIKLEKGAPLMTGTIAVGVSLTDDGAANDLVLDWRTTPFANDKDKPYARVLNVNGAAAEANIVDEHLVVAKSALKTGRNEIVIEFASPIKTSGAAVTRYIDKEDGGEYVYTLFVPSDASMAFPVFDQPDLKARFTLNLTVPDGWKAVANSPREDNNAVVAGSSESAEKTGPAPVSQRISFQETKRISTYVFAFAAGDFAAIKSEPPAVAGGSSSPSQAANDNPKPRVTAGGSDLAPVIYVRKSQAEKFKQHEKEVSRLNREGVRFLEEYFDYKFPFPKYDLVLIPEFPFGGMEHAGATFLREASIIFPSEPTKNDFIARANLIFHEAAHQWFGDTVTMKWFDDLWLKEGFAEFMAYKTLEKVMPEYNAWKAFYERNKPLAYLTDSTKGTTPIYQEIPNLSSAKSAYGNIVYRKAPSFLKQAEFYLGADKFQTATRSFLKKHEFANAEWKDLVTEFARARYNLLEAGGAVNAEQALGAKQLVDWADRWIMQRGAPIIKLGDNSISQNDPLNEGSTWAQRIKIYTFKKNPDPQFKNTVEIESVLANNANQAIKLSADATFIFPNYQDYGYGIFLLDPKSREYVLRNIRNENDDFLRSMMWGTLWDSVREGELDPREYVDLAIKNIEVEEDESTINAILGRVATSMNYYITSDTSAVAGGSTAPSKRSKQKLKPPTTAGGFDLSRRLENILAERMANAKTPGQRITFYRAYLNLASTVTARRNLKDILAGRSKLAVFQLRTKDKFDIVTRLMILGDADAPRLLAALEKSETSDDAKRFAYAARAGIATEENKARYFRDFIKNKDISESWIEAAFVPFNSARHSEITLQYLETALAELPNLKRTRKIFFVNGWLGAFIGGQKSEEALSVINKFLETNKILDRDLRLKILENADVVERAVNIRKKWGK
jgi:aminopeptidase N